MTLHPGRTITLGFSLADPHDGRISILKQRHIASHLGLLVLFDDTEAGDTDTPGQVLLWLHQSGVLTLIAQSGDGIVSDDVRAILPRYFAAFFDEIKELAPDLAGVTLAMIPTNDKTLH